MKLRSKVVLGAGAGACGAHCRTGCGTSWAAARPVAAAGLDPSWVIVDGIDVPVPVPVEVVVLVEVVEVVDGDGVEIDQMEEQR